MTPWQFDTLCRNRRLLVPLPMEQPIQFCGDPGAVPTAVSPVPMLEIRLVRYDKAQAAVLLEFIFQDKSTLYWFTVLHLSEFKGDIVAFAMHALQAAERKKARESKQVRERYEKLVTIWLHRREWREDCSCADDAANVCWYHMDDEARRKERTRTMVDLLVGAL